MINRKIKLYPIKMRSSRGNLSDSPPPQSKSYFVLTQIRVEFVRVIHTKDGNRSFSSLAFVETIMRASNCLLYTEHSLIHYVFLELGLGTV